MSFSLGKLSSLLAIAGGAVGLANSDSFASGLSSGASIVAGAAGLAGQSNLAKIAGVTALGAGAYSAFGGASTVDKQSNTVDAPDASKSTIQAGQDAYKADSQPSFDDALKAPATPMPTGFVDNASQLTMAPPDSAATGLGGATAPGSLPANPLPSLSSGSVATTPKIVPTVAPTGMSGSLLDASKNLSGWMRDNKELVNVGASALNGMFGAGAQQNSLLQQQLAQRQAIIDRANSNANNLGGLTLGVAANPNAMPLVRPRIGA